MPGLGAIRARSLLLLAAAGLAALALASEARGSSVRVAKEYFSLNFQAVANLDAAGRERHLASIEALGLRAIRVNFAWPVIEPEAPSGGQHSYRFGRYDAVVADAARHRIRVQPTIVQSPGWNVASGVLGNPPRCSGTPSRRPVSTAPYVELVGAVARRYGAGGSFWAEHPKLPPRPFTHYEIWNEANLAGTWCPEPEPERYAEMLASSIDRVEEVDPAALVYPGGLSDPTLPAPEQLPIEQFLRRMLAQHPSLRERLRVIAVHAFTTPIPSGQTARVADFRRYVRVGGIPDSTPMIVNEIGWPTRGAPGTVSEKVRAEAFRALVRKLARTNCNIGGIAPHVWSSKEEDPDSTEDWFGIADPFSGTPYPSANKIGGGVRLLRGKRKREAPVRTIRACKGMPKPNTDGDRRRDERDYFPLKAKRWKAPPRAKRWP